MSRQPVLLGLVLIAVVAVQIVPIAAQGVEPWPAEWTTYTTADLQPINAPGGDNNPGYTDLWSGDATGIGELPTVYWTTDGTTAFFRMRVRDDPEVSRGGSFSSSVWMVQIAVDGVHAASVGLDGKPAGTNDLVYVTTPDGSVLEPVYVPVVPDGGATGGGRVVADGDGGFFVDFQLPISAITAVAPEVTADAPVQLYYGSSTNTNNINKDFMLGDEVSFAGLAVVALGGGDGDGGGTVVTVDGPALTADPSPVIYGTGDPGSAIDVEVGGQVVTTTVGADGSWSVEVAVALTDGAYTVTATATDDAGNTATDTLEMTVDASTFVSVESADVTGDTTPVISGTGEPGSTVEVEIDGQVLTTTVAADGSWSVEVPAALADGSYPVVVTATDPLGNTSFDTQLLTVDAATVVAVDGPALTADAAPVVHGTGEPGSTVEVVVDGQVVTATVLSDGTWSVEVPVALADGAYNVSVTATDLSGNVATTDHTLTVDTVTVLAVDGPALTADATPVISGSGEPGSTVEVVVDGQVLTTTVAGDGSWSVEVPVALADGTYPVTATATDAAGNVATSTLEMTVDVSTVVAVAGPVVASDPTPVINGTGEPGSTVEVEVDGVVLTGIVDSLGNWSVSVPVAAALADGVYTVTATATDAAGNNAVSTLEMTVDVSTFVAVESAPLTSDATPVISGSGEPGSLVVVEVDGQLLSSTVAADGTWSVEAPVALADGSYPVTVTATDPLGNVATTVQNLTVDTSTVVGVDGPALTSDATPVINGSGEPGSTVEVEIDGQLMTAVVDSAGRWSVAVPVALADGVHTITATATDLLGNTAVDTQPLEVDAMTFVLVESAPLTSDATPVISGMGEPGSTVVVEVDGQVLPATVAADGTWSVEVPVALGDGTYPVTVSATDLLGNVATTVQNLTVDTTTVVAVAGPAVARDPVPVVGGTAELGATVVVEVDGQMMTAVVDSLGNWSVSVPLALPDGTYTVTATATDAAGNTASSTLDMTVDASTFVAVESPPLTADATPIMSGSGEPGSAVVVEVDGQVVTTTVLADGSWSVEVPGALADGSHPVTVTATDPLGNVASTVQNLTVDTTTAVAVDGPAVTADVTPVVTGTGEPGSAVEVVVDGQVVTTTVLADGSWSVEVPVPLADGTYTVTSTVTDAAGNIATSTLDMTVDASTFVTVDSPLPTNDTTPTLSGTGEPGSAVEVVVDGQVVTTTVLADGSWSVEVPVALADGSYPVTVTATDPLGNAASETQFLTVDTTTEVGSIEPIGTDGATPDSTPTIIGLGEPGSTVEVVVDGQVMTTTVLPDGSWSVEVPVDLADGTYEIAVTVTDPAGNTVSATSEMTVDASTFVDADGPLVVSDATPTLTGTAEPGSMVEVVVDGQVVTTTVADDGTWSVEVPVPLADGSYPVTVTVTDPLGNTAVDTQFLTLDTEIAVSVDGPALTTDRTPTVVGTGEPGATIEVVVGDQTITTTVAGDGSWSVVVPAALADGTYTVTATATDEAGNTATDTLQMTVDASTFVTVDGPALTNDTTPTLSGTGEPGSTIEVVVDGQLVTTTVAGDGTWSVEVPVLLPDGSYSVTVTATDPLGNIATASQQLTIDTVTFVTVDGPVTTTDATPTLTGTGEPGATIEVTVGGQVIVTVVGDDGSWSVTLNQPLGLGTYTVVVQSTDAAGNQAQRETTLTIRLPGDVLPVTGANLDQMIGLGVFLLVAGWVLLRVGSRSRLGSGSTQRFR